MIRQIKKELNEFKIKFDSQLSGDLEHTISIEPNEELLEIFRNLKYYVLNGGKRLRPYILYNMNKDFTKFEKLWPILFAFEILHNSTLVDDDILDQHEVRRNQETILSIYKKIKSNSEYFTLLSAHILRDMSINLILKSKISKDFKIECLSAYENICYSIDRAQVLDLKWRNKLDISEEDYLNKVNLISAKFIAYMFQLCAPKNLKNEFFEIGISIGIAYQLADDLMDVDDLKKKGRALYSDILQGTPTLLSIYTYKKLNFKDKEKFINFFGKKDISQQNLAWIINQYKITGALDYLSKKITFYVSSVYEKLNIINFPRDHWIYIFPKYILSRDE